MFLTPTLVFLLAFPKHRPGLQLALSLGSWPAFNCVIRVFSGYIMMNPSLSHLLCLRGLCGKGPLVPSPPEALSQGEVCVPETAVRAPSDEETTMCLLPAVSHCSKPRTLLSSSPVLRLWPVPLAKTI